VTLPNPACPATPRLLHGASSVVVAPNGDIFVGDGHGGNTNDRVVKFDKTGKQIATGASTARAGRVRPAARIARIQGRFSCRPRQQPIQVFDSTEVRCRMKQFGRRATSPSTRRRDLRTTISRTRPPIWFQERYPHRQRQGGKVTAFIPTPMPRLRRPKALLDNSRQCLWRLDRQDGVALDQSDLSTTRLRSPPVQGGDCLHVSPPAQEVAVAPNQQSGGFASVGYQVRELIRQSHFRKRLSFILELL